MNGLLKHSMKCLSICLENLNVTSHVAEILKIEELGESNLIFYCTDPTDPNFR